MSRTVRLSLPPSLLALLASETILLFGCYILAAAYWTPSTLDLEFYLLAEEGLLQIALLVAVIQAGMYFQLLYESLVLRSRLVMIQKLCIVLGFAFAFQALAGYTNTMLQLPKETMIYGSLLALLALPLWRSVSSTLIKKAIPVKRLLFIGDSPVIPEMTALLAERPDLGLPILPPLSGFQQLEETIRTQRPDGIVTFLKGNPLRLPTQSLLDLQSSGLQIQESDTLYEALTGKVFVPKLNPADLIIGSQFEPPASIVMVQRFYSLAAACVITAITLPLLAVVALLVKAFSPGPVLVRQKRVGRGGAYFDLYRFRTTELTFMGRWLRRLRLEGFPSWLNVLRGDISIVGPQPERPEFAQLLEAQIPFYGKRHCVRPGLTGWAQINSPDSNEIRDSMERLQYDFYYLKRMSYALDAYVLLHTFPTLYRNRTE